MIRTQIFKYSPYEHGSGCPKRTMPPTSTTLGNDYNPETRKFDVCRECRNQSMLVEVDGVKYVNWPGGRIEHRPGIYAGEGEIVMSITHEGLVIASRERNYTDDSDFYALVWNPERQSVEEVSVGTTRLGGTDHNSASVDLAPEHLPAYREYLIREEVRAIRSREVQSWQEAAYDAVTPHKGVEVEVVAGRKVPKGTRGVVFWTDERSYSYYATTLRIGFKDEAGETFWTDAKNVRVLTDPDDLPYLEDFRYSDEEVLQRATATVDYSGMASWLRRTQSAPGMLVVP